MADASPASVEPPGAGLDLTDARVVIDLFERAAAANLDAEHRQGATAHLPPRHELLMTGDLHDHGQNLLRICTLAALDKGPHRHVVLHEVVHGPSLVNGRDLSIRTLARIAALKLQYPQQVHILQSNHELAQLGGKGITKDGVDVVKAYNDGVSFIYDDDAPAVLEAMCTYIRSLLLAVRLPNGIICCHSVPSPRVMSRFDHTVIDRVPTENDLKRQGAGYEMVWGRNHTPDSADDLAARWSVKLFIMGHQPADMGYVMETRNMLVLASDHAHGMVLPLGTSRDYEMDDLIELMLPLASVSV